MRPILILVINSILYVILLILSIYKKRGLLGIIMTSFYTILAIGCAFFYNKGDYWNLNLMLWPFLYSFIIFLILIWPFQKKTDIVNMVSIPNTSLMNVFFDFYLVVSVLYIIALFGSVVQALRSGSWLSIYVSMRGEDAILYTNFYQRFLINVTSYLKTPAVFYAFYTFAKNINYKRKSILLIMPLITSFMWAINTASRSSFMAVGVLYLICYVICSTHISTTFKRRFITVLSIFGALAAAFILSVNVSRFGEGNDEWTSAYFGHSYIVGHNTIAFTNRLGYGSNFFGFLYDTFHINVPRYNCLVDDGVAFHPMIGMRFSDYGLVGTIVYAFLVSWLFTSILKKKNITFGGVYMTLYFYCSLFTGALYDNTNILSWLIVISVSLILTFLTKIEDYSRANMTQPSVREISNS